MKIRKYIDLFRSILSASYTEVDSLLNNDGDELINNWKQVNWELIVEGNIGPTPQEIFLVPYADGADFNSSRILYDDKYPNYSINCISAKKVVQDQITGNVVEFPEDGLLLDRFVTMKDGWYWEEKPFDCVLLFIRVMEDDELIEREVIVSIDDIEYSLCEYNEIGIEE